MAQRCRKLTPDERKAVWSQPTSNAGVGWAASGASPDGLDDLDNYERQQAMCNRLHEEEDGDDAP